MEKAQCKNTRVNGARNVSSVAASFGSADGFADMLRAFSSKEIARRLRLRSVRTVENWKQRRSSPHAKHVVAMLSDDELCAKFLKAAGREDLADSAATIAKLRAALGAVEGK